MGIVIEGFNEVFYQMHVLLAIAQFVRSWDRYFVSWYLIFVDCLFIGRTRSPWTWDRSRFLLATQSPRLTPHSSSVSQHLWWANLSEQWHRWFNPRCQVLPLMPLVLESITYCIDDWWWSPMSLLVQWMTLHIDVRWHLISWSQNFHHCQGLYQVKLAKGGGILKARACDHTCYWWWA